MAVLPVLTTVTGGRGGLSLDLQAAAAANCSLCTALRFQPAVRLPSAAVSLSCAVSDTGKPYSKNAALAFQMGPVSVTCSWGTLDNVDILTHQLPIAYVLKNDFSLGASDLESLPTCLVCHA